MLQSETAANPQRMEQALRGLRRYQEAPRAPLPEPRPVVAELHGAMLRDYGGDGSPVLFVPSLINPPNILDLAEDRSLLRWLAGRGRRILLLDWGGPDGGREGLSVAGHVEHILLPLITSQSEPVDLVGYCLGGTMAAAAAQLAPVRSLATLAAPWRFSAFPDESRDRLQTLWTQFRPATDRLGLLPMEALQSAFWSLDPARNVAKFEAFADMPPREAAAFVALEDWANDGPPLPLPAAEEIFADFFRGDLPGRGAWQVGGERIEPHRLTIPMLEIISTTDRIVPAASAIGAGEQVRLDSGHVGMVIGSRARETLWTRLADWLSLGPQ